MPTNHRSAQSSKNCNLLERKRQAFELRKRGLSYRAIGDAMGMSYNAAHQYVKEAYQMLLVEVMDTAEELRQIELDRLDAIQDAIWTDCETGDKAAISTMLKVMERRSKLLGLDTVQATDNTVHIVMDQVDSRLG